jgi:voltage-gated potassium channel
MSATTRVPNLSALWRWLGLEHHNWPGRFTVLLATILLLLVSQPILVGHALAQGVATVTISLVLLTALYAFRSARVYFIVALVLVIPSLGCRLAMLFTWNPTIELAGAASSCLFLAVTVIALVTRLFIVRSVTLDTINAGICAYLLTAVVFAYGFEVVELQHPGSFSTALFQRSGGNVEPLASLHNFIYYSFVCLTTTGFGDIAPLSGGARGLSVMESVFGQLYVAILIARLVSLEVAQSMTKEQ